MHTYQKKNIFCFFGARKPRANSFWRFSNIRKFESLSQLFFPHLLVTSPKKKKKQEREERESAACCLPTKTTRTAFVARDEGYRRRRLFVRHSFVASLRARFSRESSCCACARLLPSFIFFLKRKEKNKKSQIRACEGKPFLSRTFFVTDKERERDGGKDD